MIAASDNIFSIGLIHFHKWSICHSSFDSKPFQEIVRYDFPTFDLANHAIPGMIVFRKFVYPE